MNTRSYSTVLGNAATANKSWVIIDAENEVLGRLASKAAYIIRGKHKTNFTPHADCGDNVIIINAAKVRLTGKKMKQKVYIRHTDYPGGQRAVSAQDMFNKKPAFAVERAVKKMISRNKLGHQLFSNLFVYAGAEHPHEAQQPKAIHLKTFKERNN